MIGKEREKNKTIYELISQEEILKATEEDTVSSKIVLATVINEFLNTETTTKRIGKRMVSYIDGWETFEVFINEVVKESKENATHNQLANIVRLILERPVDVMNFIGVLYYLRHSNENLVTSYNYLKNALTVRDVIAMFNNEMLFNYVSENFVMSRDIKDVVRAIFKKAEIELNEDIIECYNAFFLVDKFDMVLLEEDKRFFYTVETSYLKELETLFVKAIKSE